jgi:hypothetical protein
MSKILREVLDWSEVWATLIPLTVYIWVRPKAKWSQPLLIYLLIALLLGLVIDVTWKSTELGLKDWVEKTFWWLYHGKVLYTLVFYNINSFVRLVLVTCFFYIVNPLYRKTYIITTCIFVAGVIVNFVFFEDIVLSFSSRLLAVEAAIILFYCLLYYYTVNMNDEIRSPLGLPPFWVVMGLTLYTSVNFLIFLFYNYLINAELRYAISIWNVHNIIYIVLMIFIAVAFKKAK